MSAKKAASIDSDAGQGPAERTRKPATAAEILGRKPGTLPPPRQAQQPQRPNGDSRRLTFAAVTGHLCSPREVVLEARRQ